jgi:hypothetical protein
LISETEAEPAEWRIICWLFTGAYKGAAIKKKVNILSLAARSPHDDFEIKQDRNLK